MKQSGDPEKQSDVETAIELYEVAVTSSDEEGG